ncbi:thymopoietin b [Trichomycterus rosablanca]|uniref:thymopoietin b n=1 Tax=Trichomycterus rosablanca TaxID=2290929 RepID=UPI002F359D14
MAEFLKDPTTLTKEKLKNELRANDVPLPSGDQKKDVYVQLYLKHLTVLNEKTNPSPDTFSSDEEIVPVVSNKSRSGKKAIKKTDKNRKEEVDVESLTDSDLKDELLKHGINSGPIVASTRKLYEKRLQKLLDQPTSVSTQPEPETAVPETVTLTAGGSQNGNTHSVENQYSDKEEEIETVPVSTKPVRSRGITPVTTRTSSRHHIKQVEERAADGRGVSLDKGDILKEMFPNEPSTPTGIIASCRRPIRGAAERPVKPLDLWSEESLLRQRVLTSTTAATTKTSLSQSYSAPAPAPRPSRCSFSFWLKLLVFLALVALLYYAYQNVSSKQIDSCILFLQDSVITPLLTLIGVIGHKDNAGSK